MKTKLCLTVLFTFITHLGLFAQENNTTKNRAVQVTFGYPIGSNGINSMDYSNSFSLNILYGLNGGVRGAEIGSIFNYNKGNVTGAQMAGVANINTGFTNGVALSGVFNLSKGNLQGAQISTINWASNELIGTQISVLNYATSFQGLQLGVMNYTEKFNGLQVAVVNIANDAETGVSFGLINVVNGGLFEIELTTGEVLYANLNYKMGTDRLYTIYKAGISSYKNMMVNSYGLGFGTTVYLGERSMLNIDLSGNQIILDNDWDSDLNMLNKLDVNYKFTITDFFTVLVGPSLNIYVSEVFNGEGYGTLEIPYTLSTNEYSSGTVASWVGINAGVSFVL